MYTYDGILLYVSQYLLHELWKTILEEIKIIFRHWYSICIKVCKIIKVGVRNTPPNTCDASCHKMCNDIRIYKCKRIMVTYHVIYLISFLKFCFIFVIQLYEPLGVVLFVTPFFNMRKSFYTCSVNTQLVISLECMQSLMFRSYHTCQV